MITLSSAENVLKDVYLGVIADQINTKTNPLFSRIKRSTRNIAGKEVRVVAPVGINGGIMAGTETSELPAGVGAPYLSFTAPLKNLYGRLEISDKAIRCASTDVNSFVNLLEDSMDSLLRASIFNLSRMIYGDGSGYLTYLLVDSGKFYANDAQFVEAGMVIDIYNGEQLVVENVYISSVDKSSRIITIENYGNVVLGTEYKLYLHGSKNNEITGLKGIVKNTNLYGVSKTDYPIMNPKTYTATKTDAFDEEYVQKVIDDLEITGTAVNFINSSYELKRLYQKYMTLYKKNIDYVTLEDGTRTVSHMGIPMVATNQIGAGECYFLNTDDFMFYELGDWKWLEDESGRVLKQHPTKAAYSATLVKYTELLCQKPSGIAFCSGLPTTVPTSDSGSGSGSSSESA